MGQRTSNSYQKEFRAGCAGGDPTAVQKDVVGPIGKDEQTASATVVSVAAERSAIRVHPPPQSRTGHEPPAFASCPAHDLYMSRWLFLSVVFITVLQHLLRWTILRGETSCICLAAYWNRSLWYSNKSSGQPDTYATFVSQSLRECRNHSEYHRNP